MSTVSELLMLLFGFQLKLISQSPYSLRLRGGVGVCACPPSTSLETGNRPFESMTDCLAVAIFGLLKTLATPLLLLHGSEALKCSSGIVSVALCRDSNSLLSFPRWIPVAPRTIRLQVMSSRRLPSRCWHGSMRKLQACNGP